ncbi:F-box/LRR-repeat protein 25 isoform X2 [Nicotiana tabacum]|uniref:F-box/LRR-repeat protein 25 isoform X2 n=2 Tax=Nicotiana TaxID=4085 RepID=A0A1S4CHI7_TOBAC|nr:PREDICTED: putative F-box/LRR-repeat protein At3g28410 isoform X2 [Nicotiana sylvestris]XP_016500474.1 PREDICTED: putative F-box/LRR-repeat protein At3g28410 isoform X2 [Nicotiana tabacum]
MDGLDQFSKLPMPILQHILSFLIVKDAAKTSVLSKTWNSAWSSLSCLNFGDIVFMESKNVLDQILANRQKQNISIQRFKAKLPDNRLKYVDNWIKILVAGNIKELHLEVFTSTNKLPEAIFAAKALNMLCLGGFKLELPSDGIKFSSLRELHLIKSFLDDQVLDALCASCSHLEVLSFREFGGLVCFQIAGTLPKLRIVNLVNCPELLQRVDITAPDLKYLHISSIIEELNVIKITACKSSLKNLNLSSVAVTDQWLENLLPNLPNLELFYLSSCSSLKSLKISSDRLKYFKVVRKVFQGGIDLLPTFKLKASHLSEVNLKFIL